MKKLLSTLLLAAAVPATALAIPADFEMPKQVVKSAEFRKPAFVKSDASINPEILMKTENRNILGKYDTLLTRTTQYFFTGQTDYNNVMQYDPTTDHVMLIRPTWSWAGDIATGQIVIKTYSDKGTVSKNQFSVSTAQDSLMMNPSFGFVSTDPTITNPQELNFCVANMPTFYFQGDNQTRIGATKFALYDPKTTVGDKPLMAKFVENGPAGTTDYDWRDLRPLGYTMDDATYYVAGNSLFADQATTKLSGKYGVIVIENTESHETQVSDFPSEFDLSKYFKEPDEPGTMFSSPMFLDKDSEGTIYALVNNFMATDLSKRVPSVKKSTDGGMTWSKDFDVMDWSVVTNFVEQYTDGIPAADLSVGIAPYEATDFIVTGKDSYSYVAKIYAQRPTDFNLFVYHIVEFYKENGVWGARAISDLRLPLEEEGKFTSRGIWITYAGTVNAVEDQLIIDDNPNANETELAVTKDGKYLVCKWIENKYDIDANGYKLLDNYADTTKTANFWKKNNDGVYEEVTWDVTLPTAVYARYREIGVPNSTWSNVVRLTDDNRMHLNTHIPNVVPDLTHIPMITSTTLPIPASAIGQTGYEELTKYNDLALSFQDMMLYNCRAALYSVYNIGPVDVKDAETTKDAISVFPNPANGEFNVKFDAATDASVEIFNTLGEKVMDVIGNTANTSTLSNGIYLIKVTSNGKVSSTLFTVAK